MNFSNEFWQLQEKTLPICSKLFRQRQRRPVTRCEILGKKKVGLYSQISTKCCREQKIEHSQRCRYWQNIDCSIQGRDLVSFSVGRKLNKTDGTTSTKPEPEFNEHTDKGGKFDTNRSVRNWSHADKYVRDGIVDHTFQEIEIVYCVRWYGYAASHDTVKPAKNICEHFILRYWQRQNLCR